MLRIVKMNKLYISLKVVDKKGKMIQRVACHKKRRILNFIKAKKFPNCTFDVRIAYGNDYKNEGGYDNKKELIYAIDVFTEKD